LLLLDSCVVLWLDGDRKRISPRALELIETHPQDRYVSPLTAYEIAWKVRREKLELRLPAREWMAAVMARHSLMDAGLDGAVALRATELDMPHGDPCDRIIAATAVVRGWTLLTPDPLLANCAGLRVAW
jgi:PIN domain nuclease of toxin-antitoxin system